ncbi:lysin [Lacticaseibacillus pantheris DSM 15945 = JCM 12539 = NBRC 106106]|uniref:Lysin n=1 Tax=Lacticaseibacillus pantheris DSM 15945 = JCM 12539 = NBRC 106106 TaxID=1423783 RepID=A0A0R1TVY9_9LACO|nr:lysin [Lacticaseibacillus pantheris DSM 15945 = JCM 12539 = NBRC 106106]
MIPVRHKFSKWLTAVAVIVAAFVVGTGAVNSTHAAKTYGPDWSKYQGAYGTYARKDDKFVVSQIGGYYNGSFVPQSTYPTQIASATAAGKYGQTYIYAEFSTRAQADEMLAYYLPKVQTPKGSVVALDVESGSPNTDAVNYALQKVKDAGYTPLLYGYKSFLTAHLDLTSLAKTWPLWLAEYPDYQVRTEPDYNFFPSFDNVQVFQFTSTAKAGGLDENVDFNGLMSSGYNGRTTASDGKTTVHPATTTPAIEAGQQANNTAKRDLKAGDVVKVNLGATRWETGQGIPSWVRGKTYTVSAVSGTRVLLGGIMSWANRSDVEILATTSVPSVSSGSTYTVQSGDSWWSIAYKYGMSMYTLASKNGKTINSVIHPGDVLRVSGTSYSSVASHTYYTVRSGDSFWSIASKYGISIYTLAANNGKSIYSLIYPGESLYIR